VACASRHGYEALEAHCHLDILVAFDSGRNIYLFSLKFNPLVDQRKAPLPWRPCPPMAIARHLPASFQKSFPDFPSYPENLIHKSTSTYPSALKAYRGRLDDASPNLLLNEDEEKKRKEKQAEVPFIDLSSEIGSSKSSSNVFTFPTMLTSVEMQVRYVNSPTKLRSVLGIETHSNPVDPTQNDEVATKRDPKCRFM
jgi:hypothetical protein